MTPADPAADRHRHDSAAGRRDFLLYLPPDRPRGLLVMLHGCRQDAEDFAAGTGMAAAAARHGLITAWPEQGTAENPRACWNWFRPGHQRRGGGEPAILAGIAADIALSHDLPRHAVGVAGFSAGAAMALVLRDTYPDVFHAVAAHSGVATGVARNAVAGLSAMQGGGPAAGRAGTGRPTLVIQGMEDGVVHPANAARIARSGPSTQLRLIPGLGHAWSGGDSAGSYTAPDFPRVTDEIVGFMRQNLSRSRRIWAAGPLASRAADALRRDRPRPTA